MPREGVALIGDNAQGKSNFLEAIYYLETLRSFRGARDAQMLGFGEEVFRVVGTTEGGDDEPCGVQVTAAFQKKGKRKKVSVDGTEPDRLTDALGHLSAVIFSPSDVDLVSGGLQSAGASSTSFCRSTSLGTSVHSRTTGRVCPAETPP